MARLKIPLLVALFFLLGMSYSAEAMLYSGGYWIDQVIPAKVGNAGKVTISIIGNMPTQPTKTSLWGPKGGTGSVSEIVGTVKSWSQDGFTTEWGSPRSILSATFDITGAAAGKYDVSFVNPEDPASIAYYYEALTVDTEATSNLWVKITGRTQVRFGATTEYAIWYGNMGNVDLSDGILYLAIPKEMTYELLFDPAPYQYFWPDTLKNDAGLQPNNQADFDAKSYNLIPLHIKNIPPGLGGPFKVNITWGNQPVTYLLRAFWNGLESSSYRPLWGE
jgi:hypothetical protein